MESYVEHSLIYKNFEISSASVSLMQQLYPKDYIDKGSTSFPKVTST